MKRTLTLITSVLAASSFSLHAEVPRAGAELPPVVVYGSAQETPKANGHLYRAETSCTELIGQEVWNLQNEKLGRIKFITADLERARLVEVVIASGGGWFGFGGKTTAVPPRSLRLDASGKVLRLDMSKARFDAAPDFQATRQGQLQTTETILGTPIHNTQGQYLGKVGSLMMDLPNARIAKVINATQAMGGEGSYVIAPQALRFNAKHNRLVLDLSFAQLKEQPIFKWVGGTRPAYQAEIIHADVPAIAMAPGQPARDARKTSRIELAIKTQSTHASDVKVVTRKAQTTLRGHVSTTAGKRQIGQIATQADKSGKVNNLLVVTALSGRPSS